MQPNYQTNQNPVSPTTVVLAIVVVLALVGLLAAFGHKKSLAEPVTTAATASSATPKKSQLPDFNNFGTLTDHGLADDQLTGLKYAFGLYSKTLSSPVKTVTLVGSSLDVVQRDPTSPDPNNVINFSVKLDAATYKAQVDYASLARVRLQLTDSSNTPVYDSGDIDINTQTPTPL
jgi:hypothetical protein